MSAETINVIIEKGSSFALACILAYLLYYQINKNHEIGKEFIVVQNKMETAIRDLTIAIKGDWNGTQQRSNKGDSK